MQNGIISDDLPTGDRLDAWNEIVESSLAPISIQPSRDHDVSWKMRSHELGPLQMTTSSASPVTALRSARQIARSDPEVYMLGQILSGYMAFDHRGNSSVCHVGDLVLYDSSRPFGSDTTGNRDPAQLMAVLTIPKAVAPLPERRMRNMLGSRIGAEEGAGTLLGGLFRSATNDPGPSAAKVGGVLIDLLGTLFEHLDGERAEPTRYRRDALLHRVRSFMLRHLDDPSLRPDTVARAHDISLRQLHRLFQDEELTVAAWIRRQRLEHCRRDLTDPRLADETISTIAARWCFPDAASFSRAFHRQFGLRPQTLRRTGRYGDR